MPTRPAQLAELCRNLSREHKVGIVLISTESPRGPVRDALEAGAHSILSSSFHLVTSSWRWSMRRTHRWRR